MCAEIVILSNSPVFGSLKNRLLDVPPRLALRSGTLISHSCKILRRQSHFSNSQLKAAAQNTPAVTTPHKIFALLRFGARLSPVLWLAVIKRATGAPIPPTVANIATRFFGSIIGVTADSHNRRFSQPRPQNGVSRLPNPESPLVRAPHAF